MDLSQRAVEIIKRLPRERLYVALYILELLANKRDEVSNEIEEMLALKAFEASCEEEEITPEEKESIARGEAEVKAGLGVKAEDVWKELGI
ncbi:MAG: hypothetical protein AB1556_02995 [Bacillota bacterium]